MGGLTLPYHLLRFAQNIPQSPVGMDMILVNLSLNHKLHEGQHWF